MRNKKDSDEITKEVRDAQTDDSLCRMAKKMEVMSDTDLLELIRTTMVMHVVSCVRYIFDNDVDKVSRALDKLRNAGVHSTYTETWVNAEMMCCAMIKMNKPEFKYRFADR